MLEITGFVLTGKGGMMMPDREKVIKGLEKIHTHFLVKFRGCGIKAEKEKYKERLSDVADAITLLKEQEAVKPILKREGRNKYYNDYVCPRCDNEVVYEQNYCSECGVKFMWEGR